MVEKRLRELGFSHDLGIHRDLPVVTNVANSRFKAGVYIFLGIALTFLIFYSLILAFLEGSNLPRLLFGASFFFTGLVVIVSMFVNFYNLCLTTAPLILSKKNSDGRFNVNFSIKRYQMIFFGIFISFLSITFFIARANNSFDNSDTQVPSICAGFGIFVGIVFILSFMKVSLHIDSDCIVYTVYRYLFPKKSRTCILRWDDITDVSYKPGFLSLVPDVSTLGGTVKPIRLSFQVLLVDPCWILFVCQRLQGLSSAQEREEFLRLIEHDGPVRLPHLVGPESKKGD